MSEEYRPTKYYSLEPPIHREATEPVTVTVTVT
jgi:hypothetical protein